MIRFITTLQGDLIEYKNLIISKLRARVEALEQIIEDQCLELEEFKKTEKYMFSKLDEMGDIFDNSERMQKKYDAEKKLSKSLSYMYW